MMNSTTGNSSYIDKIQKAKSDQLYDTVFEIIDEIANIDLFGTSEDNETPTYEYSSSGQYEIEYDEKQLSSKSARGLLVDFVSQLFTDAKYNEQLQELIVDETASFAMILGGKPSMYNGRPNSAKVADCVWVYANFNKKNVRIKIENSHPAIIPRVIFIQAQQELDRRKSMKNKQSQCFSGKYALSGITVCGDCGNAYRRVHWKNRGTVWRCKSRVDKREHNCNGRTIYEKDLHEAIIKAINETFVDRDAFLQQLNDNINSVMTDGLTDRLAELDSQLKELEAEIISLAVGGQGYDELASKILALRDERDAVSKKIATDANMKQRIDEMEDFVKGHDAIVEYSEVLVRRLIEKVTVFEKNIVIDFKSGVSVAVEI